MASIAVSRECIYCPRITTLIVPKDGYEEWQEGRFIQDALPQLNTNELELLISGVCRTCQDDNFEDDD